MSLPYFNMYPADFEADTSHLNLEEDGAYNRLLRLMWMTPGCSLPQDDAWIARRMRCDADTYVRVVKPLISEFFETDGGRVFSPRLRREALLSEAAHNRRVAAGGKGGRKPNILKENKIEPSNAKAMPKQPEPEPEEEKREANASPKKRALRLSPDWVLPLAWGDWAVAEGLSKSDVRSQADRFRDYWIAEAGARAAKLEWQATWRNWVRKAVAERKPKAVVHSDYHGAFGRIREVH